GGERFLVALALGDIRINDNASALGQTAVAYLQDGAVRTGSLPLVIACDVGREPSHFGFDVGRPILSALGKEAKIVAIPGLAFEERLRQLEQLHHLPVPGGELP